MSSLPLKPCNSYLTKNTKTDKKHVSKNKRPRSMSVQYEGKTLTVTIPEHLLPDSQPTDNEPDHNEVSEGEECISDLISDLLCTEPFTIDNFHRIYIFDFDDTIFPTSIIQRYIKIWNYTELNTIHQYHQCYTLYYVIKSCVDYILKIQDYIYREYGKEHASFVIITNASKKWFTEIKENHSKLIGEIIQELEASVPIISAKDAFESKYDDWYSEYSITAKLDAFEKYMKSIDLKGKIPVIYSIGDGKPEFEASILACDQIWSRYKCDDDVDDVEMEQDEPSSLASTPSSDDCKDNQVESVNDVNEDNEDEEEEKEDRYVLHRIELNTNRKSKNHVFGALPLFHSILSQTEDLLHHSEEELMGILQDAENMNDEDENVAFNVIDYKL